MYFFKGTQKPPLGARVNLEHPLATGFVFAVLLNEGSGRPMWIRTKMMPPTFQVGITGTTAWNGNTSGVSYQFLTTGSYIQFGTHIPFGSSFLPTAAITVCVIRRKLDTTLRTAGLFGQLSGITTPQHCGAAVPNAAGTVWWNFGGNSGANSLTVTGLTFTTNVESYIFTAGPAGSAIWQNGIKVASQSTPITRTSSTSPVTLNRGIESASSSSDIQEVNFFQVSDQQWSDELCRWWSAEPYAYLYQSSKSYSVVVASGYAHSQVVII